MSDGLVLYGPAGFPLSTSPPSSRGIPGRDEFQASLRALKPETLLENTVSQVSSVPEKYKAFPWATERPLYWLRSLKSLNRRMS